MIKVGDVFHGFCNGCFGRDSYDDKTVEAIGPDWIVVRDSINRPMLLDLSREVSWYTPTEEDMEEWKDEWY